MASKIIVEAYRAFLNFAQTSTYVKNNKRLNRYYIIYMVSGNDSNNLFVCTVVASKFDIFLSLAFLKKFCLIVLRYARFGSLFSSFVSKKSKSLFLRL